MIPQIYQILLEIQAQTTKDPLIDWQAENTIKIAVVLLLIASTAVVGVISRRLEHAIIFALVVSVIAIAFFTIH